MDYSDILSTGDAPFQNKNKNPEEFSGGDQSGLFVLRQRRDLIEKGLLCHWPTTSLEMKEDAEELLPAIQQSHGLILSSPSLIYFFIKKIRQELENNPSRSKEFINRALDKFYFFPGKKSQDFFIQAMRNLLFHLGHAFGLGERDVPDAFQLFFPDEKLALAEYLREYFLTLSGGNPEKSWQLLYPKGDKAEKNWQKLLRNDRVEVETFLLYRNKINTEYASSFRQRQDRESIFLFFAASSVDSLAEILSGKIDAKNWSAWCIGKPTAEAALRAGFERIEIAEKMQEEHMLKRIAESV